MNDRTDRTRRRVLQASAGLVTLGTLAGCSAESTENTDDDTGDGSDSKDTGDESGTDDGENKSRDDEGSEETNKDSYTVSMEPMGDVKFDGVPETWVASNGSWADMGVALGLEPPEGVWLTGRYHTQYYEEIPGVSVDKNGMTSLSQDGVDKERFYELDGDVHVMDPNFLVNRFGGWSESDIEEVEQIAPFFGNTIFSRGYPWHEDYQYYTLYEAFEKLAAVFQRRERYEAFAELHEQFQSELDQIIPPESERPDVATFWASGDEPEQFLPYVMSKGTSFKQWNDLQVGDALAKSDVQDFHSTRGSVDYETLLEVDPDVLLLRGQEARTETEFESTVVSYFQSHDVASDLTAVKNGDVYQAGPLYQGPIFNLVLTERAARQVYDIDRELFDRQRVSDIVAGNF